MTLAEFILARTGYYYREAKIESQTRILCLAIRNSVASKPINDPKKLWSIPLIDGEQVLEMDRDEVKKMFERLRPKSNNDGSS